MGCPGKYGTVGNRTSRIYGLIVPRPGLGLPGTPNVQFFVHAQIVLKWCSKRMQNRNVLASKLKLGQLFLRKIIKIVATRSHILKLK